MAIRFALALAAIAISGAAVARERPVDERNSTLTQGNVQMNVKVGVTSKADILNNFGSPNITTRDASGEEVWSYQRAATVAQATSSSEGWTILFAGQSRSAAGFKQSSRMMTLIITFNEKDIVTDFRSRTSDF